MKQLYYIVAVLLCAILSVAPENATSEIDWCNRQNISWNDFLGKPDPFSRYSAISATYLQEKHACDDFGRFRFTVNAVFVKNQSWTRDKTSSRLLHHEQLHFNITELHARKLRKLFNQLPSPCNIPERHIQQKVDSLYNEMEYAHRFYDEDTYHGLHVERQRLWDKMIFSALESLEAFTCHK